MVCGTLSFNIKELSIIGVQHLFQPIPPTIVMIQQNMVHGITSYHFLKQMKRP